MMSQTSMPSYAELKQAFDANKHPSEVHGLICGLLCGPKPIPGDWKTLVLGPERSKEADECLQSIYHYNVQHLEDFLFDFQLCLPKDSELLSDRAESLTLWCQGFLTGLQSNEVPLLNRKPDETSEAIHDLIEIAKMNYDKIASSEEDETAYTELAEYIRLAIILIYQNLHPAQTKKKNHPNGVLH